MHHFHFFLHQGVFLNYYLTWGSFQGTIFFNDTNQLLPVPHIWVQGFQLLAGCMVIVTIRNLINQNHEYWICRLMEVSSCRLTCILFRIYCQALVALPSPGTELPNLVYPMLQTYLELLLLNRFGKYTIFQSLPVPRSRETICNNYPAVQGSVLMLFANVLFPDYAPMLLHQILSHL